MFISHLKNTIKSSATNTNNGEKMTKEELKTKKVSAISLGCDKNRVDLEKMLFLLSNYGCQIIENVEDADIVIVNTCAFILPAKQEAIENIIEMEALKKAGKIEKLIITGCLPARHMRDVKQEFSSADAILPLSENKNIVNVVENLYGVKNSKISTSFDRILTSSPSYAYLKIADGCNNVCSFCTIPRIRGKYKSERMDDLVSEAKLLAKRGVKELILVAQDTTRYGIDLYGKPMLVELCEKLVKIKEIEWIRIHYAYPEMVDKKLLDFIENQPKMCKYIDIPLQHIDNDLLISMRRKHDEEFTRNLIKDIRTNYPDIKIRSTFIVGYPGESSKSFKKLVEFLKEVKLDYVGFFPYYREENTISYFMKGQVPNFIKQLRLKKVQSVQEKIAFERAKRELSRKTKVLVDAFDDESGLFVGHTDFLSPLVDFNVKIVDNGNVEIGKMYDVILTDFDGNSYEGEIQ